MEEQVPSLIEQSNYISRDLSWIQFNHRVLDQAKNASRSLFERLKFMAITASNLDEFFIIRVGSLYNYIDYGKERIDYSGMREIPFKKKLFEQTQAFSKEKNDHFVNDLLPEFEKNGLKLAKVEELTEKEQDKAKSFFKKMVHPMLTPMAYDNYHAFPVLVNKVLIFGVVTKNLGDRKHNKKLSFVQIPKNLPRFYEVKRKNMVLFVPIENIIKEHIAKLFRNVEILSTDLIRITRNGDFTLQESEDMEANFIEEVQSKLKTRKTGRVVRIETFGNPNKWMMRLLSERWKIDEGNIFKVEREGLMDLTDLWQVVKHEDFKHYLPAGRAPVPPLSCPPEEANDDIFDLLKRKDILLHHPFNSVEPLLKLLESAAEDPGVLAIKITIYRLAEDSRVVSALLKAAENGKHISVLFEIKARFDEEKNIKHARRLQEAGCFVIYGVSSLKTHTKLLLIVRKEGKKVIRYVHMSSGNYNEDTSRLYTDLGLLSSNEEYANDISEFFNVITGHSLPHIYERLITAPREMRIKLIELINNEAENAKNGLPCGIVIKINSLQDKAIIDALYEASTAGVPIKLIVRGICCLKPGREGLSDNIEVISIVGEFLEHSRIYYFHNNSEPKVYGGSADVMVRSFDRRIESLFLIMDGNLQKEAINMLLYSLRDNVNGYLMSEDGSYTSKNAQDTEPFDSHKELFNVQLEDLVDVKLF